MDGDGWEDLFQEILMQIWRSLPRFRSDSSIDTWAYRIAVNTSLSWRRGLGRRRRGVPTAGDVTVDAIARPSPTDSGTVLDRFLASLGELDRAVVLLHLDNLDADQIADVIGSTPGAVRTRLSRIRTKIHRSAGTS